MSRHSSLRTAFLEKRDRQRWHQRGPGLPSLHPGEARASAIATWTLRHGRDCAPSRARATGRGRWGDAGDCFRRECRRIRGPRRRAAGWRRGGASSRERKDPWKDVFDAMATACRIQLWCSKLRACDGKIVWPPVLPRRRRCAARACAEKVCVLDVKCEMAGAEGYGRCSRFVLTRLAPDTRARPVVENDSS